MAGLDSPSVNELMENGTPTMELQNLEATEAEMNQMINPLGYSYTLDSNKEFDVFTIQIQNLKGVKRTIEINAPSAALGTVNNYISGKLQGQDVINLDVSQFPGYTYEDIVGGLQTDIDSKVSEIQ